MNEKQKCCGDCSHFMPVYIQAKQNPLGYLGVGRGICLLKGDILICASSPDICEHYQLRENENV